MWKIVGAIGALVLMVISGIVTLYTTIIITMGLGDKFHDNPWYYNQSIKATVLIWGLSAMSFLAPGVIVWYLCKRERPWKFSLRTLLIVTTLIAVVLAIGVSFFSWLGGQFIYL
jgi:hypothetical protein